MNIMKDYKIYDKLCEFGAIQYLHKINCACIWHMNVSHFELGGTHQTPDMSYKECKFMLCLKCQICTLRLLHL